MGASIQDAYDSLTRAKDCLEKARSAKEGSEQSAQLKLCLHAFCQAARMAYRCYEVTVMKTGSIGGGEQTWLQNELEDYMRLPFRDFAKRGLMPFDQYGKDCENWLVRAKSFVDTVARGMNNVARPVYDENALHNAQNIQGWSQWDLDKNAYKQR